MEILKKIFSRIAIVILIIFGVYSLFPSVIRSTLDIFIPKKPLIIERRDFTLNLENYSGGYNSRFRKVVSDINNTEPIDLVFMNGYASLFACGSDEPVLFTVDSEPYEKDSDFDYEDRVYSDKLEAMRFGENNFLKIRDNQYMLIEPSGLFIFEFYPDSCQGRYALSKNEEKKILSGAKVISRGPKVPEHVVAYKKFIEKKLANPEITPTQCFSLSDPKNFHEQKICEDFTDIIAGKALSKISDAFHQKRLQDEESCKTFVSNFPPAEQDAAINEFDYKGTRSICASVYAWERLR